MSRPHLLTGLLLMCLLGLPGVAHAQFFPFGGIPEDSLEEGEEEDELVTDRDSFTPATSVVGYHRTIIESAYSFIDNRHVAETHSVPEMITRYGLTENIELHIGWNWEVGGASNPITGNVSEDEEVDLTPESKILYGGKFFLTDQQDWVPESSFILQGFTPTSGDINDSNLSATYVSGWTLPNGWIWDSALRYSTGSEKEDHFNVWAPSTVMKIPIWKHWNAHAEYFGVFSEGREQESTQHFFSPGLHYTMTPNFEIGVRVGWGLNEQAPNFFSNAGIGWRF